MDAPQIQYAKTSDGVSIAYYATGEGPAVVWMELPSHLQAEWKLLPEQRRVYEGGSRIATLVRYDHRGFGLSERDISAFPLDALVKDLEAVVDKLGLTTFVLLAMGGFTPPVAIAYAVFSGLMPRERSLLRSQRRRAPPSSSLPTSPTPRR
jgi:pimeloyl-ACP methyl ester carboxylesterase